MEFKDKTIMISDQNNYVSDLEKRCEDLEKELGAANWEPTHETSIEFRFDVDKSNLGDEYTTYRAVCYINSKKTYSSYHYKDMTDRALGEFRCRDCFVVEILEKLVNFGFKLEDLNLPFNVLHMTNVEFVNLCNSNTIVHSGVITAMPPRDTQEEFGIEFKAYAKYSKFRKFISKAMLILSFAWFFLATLWIAMMIFVAAYSFFTEVIVKNEELEVIKIHGESMWQVKDKNGHMYRVSIPDDKNMYMTYEEPTDE